MRKYVNPYIISIIAIVISIMSYLDLGFNENLSVVTQPPQLNPQAFLNFTSEISGDQIGSEINGKYIDKLNFNKLKGGILTLGGENNTNGIFTLLDDQNTERIGLTKDGMTISNGSIVIKDATNSSIIDAQGLVSGANFKSAGKFSNTYNTTTSTTYTDLPEAVLPSLVFTRSTKVLIYMTISGINSNFASDGSFIRVEYYDSFFDSFLTNFGVIGIFGPAPYSDYQTVSITRVREFEVGTHNFKLKYKVVGTGTAEVIYYEFGYLVLGS